MKEFNSFGSFARFLGTLAVARGLENAMLETACQAVESRAKEKIGEYQPEAGPFSAWAPLAPSTKEGRLRAGYPDDEPLLRRGDLRDWIEHKVVGREGHVGSNSDVALWQELGTKTIPPRSFLGGAAFELAPIISREIGVAYLAHLSGGGRRIGVR
jgi:hypothetical protein